MGKFMFSPGKFRGPLPKPRKQPDKTQGKGKEPNISAFSMDQDLGISKISISPFEKRFGPMES